MNKEFIRKIKKPLTGIGQGDYEKRVSVSGSPFEYVGILYIVFFRLQKERGLFTSDTPYRIKANGSPSSRTLKFRDFLCINQIIQQRRFYKIKSLAIVLHMN
jgi:hypothetical protein